MAPPAAVDLKQGGTFVLPPNTTEEDFSGQEGGAPVGSLPVDWQVEGERLCGIVPPDGQPRWPYGDKILAGSPPEEVSSPTLQEKPGLIGKPSITPQNDDKGSGAGTYAEVRVRVTDAAKFEAAVIRYMTTQAPPDTANYHSKPLGNDQWAVSFDNKNGVPISIIVTISNVVTKKTGNRSKPPNNPFVKFEWNAAKDFSSTNAYFNPNSGFLRVEKMGPNEYKLYYQILEQEFHYKHLTNPRIVETIVVLLKNDGLAKEGMRVAISNLFNSIGGLGR